MSTSPLPLPSNVEMMIAVDSNHGLARDGKIPWNVPDDLRFFKKTTDSHVLIMGRNTYFSLPHKKRPLDRRINIVLTQEPSRYEDLIADECAVFFKDNLEDIVFYQKQLWYPQDTNTEKKAFIIGGAQICNEYYHLCNVIWITRVKKDYNCDLTINLPKIISDYSLVEIVQETNEYVIEKYEKTNYPMHNIEK